MREHPEWDEARVRDELQAWWKTQRNQTLTMMAVSAAIDQHHCQQCSDCGRRFNVRMRQRLQPLCANSRREQVQQKPLLDHLVGAPEHHLACE